jgi:pSer/pThr/pTyr-binding forkhead associated (FHA) protein
MGIDLKITLLTPEKPIYREEVINKDEVTIGRDADIIVSYAFVSRIHGTFSKEGKKIFYSDNSKNGSTLIVWNNHNCVSMKLEKGSKVEVSLGSWIVISPYGHIALLIRAKPV